MSLADDANLLLIPTGYKAQKLYSIFPTSGVGDFDFARTTSATRVAKNGLITTVGTNVPRLNYDILDGEVVGCPHLLLEDEAINLIQYSEDFSQSAWTKGNSSIESDTLISPSGILNGSTLTDNIANTIHRLRDSVSLSASTDYGLSIFAKKGTLSNIQLALINTANSNTASRVFDLENGILGESITVGGTLQDSKITDYGNGWYRCEITAQLGSTPNTYQITLAPQSSGNSITGNQVTYDGDGNGNVYLWGAQLEEGSFSSSYIPNYGTALGVTRATETCTGSGNAATFNDSEGVLMAEISALADDGTKRYISLSDGSNSNDVRLYFDTGGYISALTKVGGSTQAFLQTNAYTQTEFHKIAIKYKLNDVEFFIDGFRVGGDLNATMPIGLSVLQFNQGNGGLKFYGKTRQIQYHSTALSDSNLEKLTSWTSFEDMAQSQLYTIQ